MKKDYVILTVTQLRQIIALAQNPTLNFIATYETETGANVEFYLNEEDEERGEEPKEKFELKSAQDYGEMLEARENVKYLIEHPQSSVDFHGLAYWAKIYEEKLNKKGF